MIGLIATIILFLSLIGIGAILVSKISILKKIEVKEKSKGQNFFSKLKEKVKSFPLFKSDFWEIFFQKLLSKIKVFSLKIETKTGNLLERMRKRARERKERERYWEKIKKPKKIGK